ncbi:MAG: winged helix-turn-helix transcriptional regulator [Candidatus Methylomirabilis oxyfera]|nr:winged helix-turn-helix transcriptional regulator [Candidatus Methylomirabilis oxyfera]
MRSPLSKNLGSAARWFHALADETRLRIIDCLVGGEECVCDLTDRLETGQSRLSFHLKTLKDAGILRDRREGRWVYYSLNPEAIAEMENLIGSIKPRSRGLHVASNRCE